MLAGFRPRTRLPRRLRLGAAVDRLVHRSGTAAHRALPSGRPQPSRTAPRRTTDGRAARSCFGKASLIHARTRRPGPQRSVSGVPQASRPRRGR
ncbi:hypothetical protein HMPREF0682_2874 [Propionibacterium acidifaciens F0233]|uniref:Uncharacterized protein n=1 Tax=Propionibacterium acidifaciens F0233 TaxID=553198 RepID=U2QND3_9ACTN|nr:hypothetical protein HMPREF0682_2874 [Propionibacterium acidifaciens F0233]